MPLYEPAMAYFSEVVSYWLPVEIWGNQQQDSIGCYDGLGQIRWQAIIWINDGNFTCNTHSCRTWDNFMTMRLATIWRRICWANYRTQYCRIFMKFTGTYDNTNTALSATYQMDMLVFFQGIDSNELLCQYVGQYDVSLSEFSLWCAYFTVMMTNH